MLQHDLRSNYFVDRQVDVHPFALGAAAMHAPLSEISAVFNAFAKSLSKNSFRLLDSMLINFLEMLPPERRAYAPPEIWAKLLQSSRPEFRERVVILLGDISSCSSNRRDRALNI